MPVEPNPEYLTSWPNQVNIPPQDQRFTLSLQIQDDGTPTNDDRDEILQSLIDHLQTWPGRDVNLDVRGSRYQTYLYLVTPTDPIDQNLPDPEPESGTE